VHRRTFLSMLAAAWISPTDFQSKGVHLAQAARTQLGITTGYDPNYTRIHYPGGDVPRTTGVCADVIVRAARDAFQLDLQQLVHEDMLRDFNAYPSRHTWALQHPDPNIDHRRALNLQAYWRRANATLWSPQVATSGDAFHIRSSPATSSPGSSTPVCHT
jgi:uncharacterized protein YijF (DUF1287 family)